MLLYMPLELWLLQQPGENHAFESHPNYVQTIEEDKDIPHVAQ